MIVTAMNQEDITQTAIKDNKLYLLDDLNSRTYDKVVILLKKHDEIDTIVLTAISGSLDDEATFKLGRYIRKHRLNTHLLANSVIASGGVDLFCAGEHRTIEEGAKLGVHSWSDGSKDAKDFPKDHPDHKLNATYTKDMLGSDDFYWFTIYAAPSKSIHWMTDKEIEKYNLSTEPFLPPSGDKTPFGEKFLDERKNVLKD